MKLFIVLAGFLVIVPTPPESEPEDPSVFVQFLDGENALLRTSGRRVPPHDRLGILYAPAPNDNGVSQSYFSLTPDAILHLLSGDAAGERYVSISDDLFRLYASQGKLREECFGDLTFCKTAEGEPLVAAQLELAGFVTDGSIEPVEFWTNDGGLMDLRRVSAPPDPFAIPRFELCSTPDDCDSSGLQENVGGNAVRFNTEVSAAQPLSIVMGNYFYTLESIDDNQLCFNEAPCYRFDVLNYLSGPGHCALDSGQIIDEHFELYYELLEEAPVPRRVPHQVDFPVPPSCRCLAAVIELIEPIQKPSVVVVDSPSG